MSRTLEDAEKRIALYEQNGAAKLFYALNRKMNEMADRLNSTDLKTISLDDPKDKTFDRIKVIWNDAASIAAAVKVLGETAGITNDESKDTSNPKYQITTPESISDVLGNKAGQHN
ncbi:MAG TPA: hypothetical protein VIM07_00780 [Chitinophagaceae bacterium]